MIRAVLLAAVLAVGVIGGGQVSPVLADNAGVLPLLPPASIFLLPMSVAGGKTTLSEQSDPPQGFVRSYAYNIAGGADAFGDTYAVDISTSHADALAASRKDRTQDHPGIANYRVEKVGGADAWAYVDSRGDAVLAGGVIDNLSFMVVYYGPQGSQDWTNPAQWTPTARRAVGVLAGLIKQAKSYPSISVQQRNAAFTSIAAHLKVAVTPCVQVFNSFLPLYESYQHGDTTAGQVSAALPLADTVCAKAESQSSAITSAAPDILDLYPSVIKVEMDWQGSISAYREALAIIRAVVDDGVAPADSYVLRYATAAANDVLSASTTADHIKQSWHLH